MVFLSFARVAPPLNKKLRKYQPLKVGWINDNEASHLDSFKSMRVHPPVMTLSRREVRFRVDTDAFEKKFGSVFVHRKPYGMKKPIRYC